MTRGGDFIDVLSTARVERDQSQRFLKAVGALVDVTERRNAEAALRQAQKMKAVGRLAGGLAHDFNNILAVILGSLEMARKRVEADARALRMIDNALEGARCGAARTQRMLTSSRRQSLNPWPLDVRTLVDGMRDMLERSLGPQVSPLIEVPPGLPLAFADPHQLEMAFLNLAVNARDAMKEGEIRIVSESGRVGPKHRFEGGQLICLSVTDNGTGMDEGTLARAHEPFFTTKGAGHGTGLGLAMVSCLAEQSGEHFRSIADYKKRSGWIYGSLSRISRPR